MATSTPPPLALPTGESTLIRLGEFPFDSSSNSILTMTLQGSLRWIGKLEVNQCVIFSVDYWPLENLRSWYSETRSFSMKVCTASMLWNRFLISTACSDIENWPICDFLISFFSDGFPIDKASQSVIHLSRIPELDSRIAQSPSLIYVNPSASTISPCKRFSGIDE